MDISRIRSIMLSSTGKLTNASPVVLMPGRIALAARGRKETMQRNSSLNGGVETALSADAEAGTRQFSRRTIAYTLMGTMLVTFIATLDQTIVGTALPRIGA